MLFYEGLAHGDLVDWAGEGGVTRADLRTVVAWRIPEADKAAIVDIGIPISDDVPITRVCLQTEAEPTLWTADGRLLYLLAERSLQGANSVVTWSWAVEPGTGVVYYVMPDGEAWFANSSVVLWVQCLHHYGLRVDTCDLLLNAEFHEEDAVLAELEELAAELKECDPPSFAGYTGFIWPEFLARWLW
ncbi:SUKH-4 family immunity protein [Streptomyces sp. NPDC051219]|uniref:SUKH-4 family immunity protein n=1 Tax=Streptomyces sp. NPDC051219 TaxID=3155283 RepID=UPI0034302258